MIIVDGAHKEFLKDQFRSQRFAKDSGETGSFVPWVELAPIPA